MASLSPVLTQATPVVVESASGCWIHGTDGADYLQGIEFTVADGGADAATAAAVQQATTEHGLLTLTCGPLHHVIRLIPALVVSPEEIDTGLERFAAAVAQVCA